MYWSPVTILANKPVTAVVNRSRECSDFGNIECSVFGNNDAVISATMLQCFAKVVFYLINHMSDRRFFFEDAPSVFHSITFSGKLDQLTLIQESVE